MERDSSSPATITNLTIEGGNEQRAARNEYQQPAEIIARRIASIRNLAAEKGEPHPAGERAQFRIMCERSLLHFGPLSTQHMEVLAAELVPAAMAVLQEERIAA
jgi:hypothetical protein